MLHRWRTAAAAALPLLCAMLVALLPAGAVAAGELETRTLTSYEVAADGGVHVTLSALVTNRDPSTQRRDSGRVFYYSATAFAVHDGASNLVARAGGGRLALENPSEPRDGADPFRLVVVRFGRDLYFGDSVEIAMEYDLAAVRASQVLVNQQYAFVPAIAQGTQSLVRIVAPAGRQLTIGSANCARTADRPLTYLCGASTATADYQAGGRCAFAAAAPRWDCAFTGQEFVVIPFEATAPGAVLATRTSAVPLSRATVELRVQYFAGDEAWAARVEDIVRRGLPILEEANGYAYPGLPAIEIVESGYRDTHGYEGVASAQGRIRLTPVVEDQTVLHEVSHLWSGIFASRWLAEGMADFTANIAARRLGLRPETVEEPVPAAPLLEQWGPLRSQIAITREERQQEEAGYARSLRFLELLAGRTGSRALALANATLAQERIKGTARSYLDTLEGLTHQEMAPLFAEWALAPEDAARLPARATAWARAADLRARATGAGLAFPRDIDEALRDWDFPRAERLAETADAALARHRETVERAMAAGYEVGGRFGATFAEDTTSATAFAADAAAALAAVQAADKRLAEERTPWMRVGLVGASPDATAATAREALARGDFPRATERAAAVRRRLDTAGRDGALRVGLALALVVAIGAALLIRGRVRSSSGRGVNVLDSAG